MTPRLQPTSPLDGATFDVAVIGAGFGGIGAAVELARRGAKVALFESLAYPGGCASTFRRKGFAFEAGATLFSGFSPDQLFGRWIDALDLPVTIDYLDPVVELRTPELRLPVALDRAAFVDSLASLPGAPAKGVRAFFAEQRRVADLLWALFDDPSLLPPFDAASLGRHALRSARYLGLLPLLGRPLGALLDKHGVAGFGPLRAYLDGLCQITVQCAAAEAEAPFALAAMDYCWRGTGHVRGGIGVLARALCDAVARLGGSVHLATSVKSVRPVDGGFVLDTRRGTVRAHAVVANVLPHALRDLLGVGEGTLKTMDRLAERVEDGWGAAMLYLAARAPDDAGPSAHHLQIVQDPGAPFIEGNHVFVSISGARDEGRAPQGRRTITASTHLPMKKLRALSEADRGAYVASVQARMRAAIEAHAPSWAAGIEHAETASPRTFARFTGRTFGYVGGIPRRAGLDNYRDLGPTVREPAH